MAGAARGWEPFLTPRDRELLAKTSWAKRAPFGLGRKPAVVVVDAYYGALGEPRMPMLDAVADWPAACGEEGWAAIDRTAPLLDQARASDVPVYYLTGLAGNPIPWSRKPRKQPRDPVREARELQIVKELAPQPGDVVLEKCSPGGFTTSPLDILLRERGIDTVIVCGETTSGCVRATVVDARVLGYRVAVVEDCCFDRLEASHWMSLFDLEQKYADVVDSGEMLRWLRELKP